MNQYYAFQAELWKSCSFLPCVMFVEIFLIFHLNIWWVFTLQHVVLIILWLRPASSHFCTFVGALPTAAKALSSRFPRPPWTLTNSGSSSLVPRMCDLPWVNYCQLRCLFSVPVWGLCWLRLSNVLVSHKFWVAHSLLPWVHELLEWTGCVFLSSARYLAQYLWSRMLAEWMFKPSLVDPKYYVT